MTKECGNCDYYQEGKCYPEEKGNMPCANSYSYK